MKSSSFAWAVVVLLGIGAGVDAGCGPTTKPAGVACKAAGGTCELGDFRCVSQATNSAQDCNPDLDPGGGFCCLPQADGGVSPAADAGVSSADGSAIASDSGTKADAALPACTWPSIYDFDASAGAPGGACMAGRAYLSCVGSNGGGEGCVSDNLSGCPGPNATPGVTYSDCQDVCEPHEYVLLCGSIGVPGDASPTSVPPTACHLSSAINPGGREPYCCPCSP